MSTIPASVMKLNISKLQKDDATNEAEQKETRPSAPKLTPSTIQQKWYSDGVTPQEAAKMSVTIGVIETIPTIGLNREKSGIQISIKIYDVLAKKEHSYRGGSQEDLLKLLVETDSLILPHVRGKYIEVYLDAEGKPKCISVNDRIR